MEGISSYATIVQNNDHRKGRIRCYLVGPEARLIREGIDARLEFGKKTGNSRARDYELTPEQAETSGVAGEVALAWYYDELDDCEERLVGGPDSGVDLQIMGCAVQVKSTRWFYQPIIAVREREKKVAPVYFLCCAEDELSYFTVDIVGWCKRDLLYDRDPGPRPDLKMYTPVYVVAERELNRPKWRPEKGRDPIPKMYGGKWS